MLVGLYILVEDDFDRPVYADPDSGDLDEELWVVAREVVNDALEGDGANTGVCQGIWQGPGVPGLLCLPGDPAECGCDGVTYLNKCQRILAGAAKDYVGACGENTCELGVEDDCGVGLYCSGPTGSCSGAGSCLATSLLCLESGPEVCGCDGKTYTSPCHAHQQDVPLESLGECP